MDERQCGASSQSGNIQKKREERKKEKAELAANLKTNVGKQAVSSESVSTVGDGAKAVAEKPVKKPRFEDQRG